MISFATLTSSIFFVLGQKYIKANSISIILDKAAWLEEENNLKKNDFKNIKPMENNAA